MVMPSPSSRLASLLLLALAGCSVSNYDTDYKARVAAFLGDAAFAELDSIPREFADGRVRVHLPAKFDGVDEESRPASLSFLRNLEEATPFNAKLFTQGNQERRPVVVVAAVPTARRKPDDLKREITEWIELDGTFRGRQWERRKVEPAKGGPAEWDVLTLDGDQSFEGTSSGGAEGLVDLPLKGSGGLWLSATPDRDYCIVVALRMPNDLDPKPFQAAPAQLVELMARRVEITPPPDGAAAAAN